MKPPAIRRHATKQNHPERPSCAAYALIAIEAVHLAEE